MNNANAIDSAHQFQSLDFIYFSVLKRGINLDVIQFIKKEGIHQTQAL
jgi:hypothetical protein